MERWKPIKGYAGLYSVSDMGRVRRNEGTVQRTIANGTTFTQRVRERILKANGKYPMVHLSHESKVNGYYVHELVALAFIGKRPRGLQVCHEDGNSRNPKASNLRYDTPKGNAEDRHRHGTHAIGVANPAAILTEAKVRKIKRLLKSCTIKAVAAHFELNYSTVRSISSGDNWSHVHV